MKSGAAIGWSLLVAFVVLLCVRVAGAEEPPIVAQAPAGTAFTYQGRLTDGGAPANGDYDFRFRLYDGSDPTTARAVTGTLILDGVAITNGLFTVVLDFGPGMFPEAAPTYDGKALWLQASVRPSGSDSPHVALSPLTLLTAAPYALTLAPGATISDDFAGTTLRVRNGRPDATLAPAKIAVSGQSSSGIAIEGVSDSGTAVFAFSSTGVAVRAAGSGVIRSDADSYVFIPGNMAVLHAASDNARLMHWGQGDVSLVSTGPGDKEIVFPLALPAVLYGQPARLEEVSFGFKPTGASIIRVELYRAGMDGSYRVIASEEGALVCEATPTGWCPPFTLAPSGDNVLSHSDGQVALRIYCSIPADSRIEFNGVRVRIGHN